MWFKDIDGDKYKVNINVRVSYCDFIFEDINKAVDFAFTAAQSHDAGANGIRLTMDFEKTEDKSDETESE